MTAYDMLIQKGEKRGLEKGREEGLKIIKLYLSGLNIIQIAEKLGLSVDKVKNITDKFSV